MTLLNQGYVRFFNLQETIDATKAINNIGGGTISQDLVVFAGNTTNKTTLKFDKSDPNNTIIQEGFALKQNGKISTFGNGDSVQVKCYLKIQNATFNNFDDSLSVTFTEPHGISDATFDGGVLFKIEDTFFLDPVVGNFSATTSLNGNTFTAVKVSTNAIKLLNIGFPEEVGIGNLVTNGYEPYATSTSLTLPITDPQISYDGTYYICFSNAIDEFRISTNYSKVEKLNQINFETPLAKNLIFERLNECTKENLNNLSLPNFQDFDFSYDNFVTDRTFNENFSLLETYLDAANFFRFKKFTSEGNEVFETIAVEFEGNLFTSDVDSYNSIPLTVYDPALRTKSPGIYILDPSSTKTNLIALRAYSDNTQPWKLLDNPDPTNDVLEYQVLRSDPASPSGPNGDPRTIANQALQCGNLIFQSADKTDPTKLITLEVESSSITSITAVDISDTIKTTFTHKLPILINGEEYSLCLDNN
jgi:hypothetical protein